MKKTLIYTVLVVLGVGMYLILMQDFGEEEVKDELEVSLVGCISAYIMMPDAAISIEERACVAYEDQSCREWQVNWSTFDDQGFARISSDGECSDVVSRDNEKDN